MSAPLYGSTWPTPFAFLDHDSSSWKMCQASLLEDSGESCTTWPKLVTWDQQFVYELPMSALPTSASESSSLLLLPSPQSSESTPTPEFVEEVRENLLDPHKRLYLPNRKWHTQRTLSRVVSALLPTPVVTDSYGSRRATARTEEWQSNPGTTLTDAIWQLQGRETDTRGKLLPTPTVQDGKNNAGPSQWERNSDPLNVVVAKLLPTPMSNQENPGAGGELRAALTHGPGRRNGTGTDSWGRPNRGRSKTGESTDPPSTDGRKSSDDGHHYQPTLLDA